MSNKKKPKKIIFSEEADSSINGYALGLSFLGIGLFLLLNPSYFFVSIVSNIFGAIIGTIGVLGTGIELSRSSKIKGMDNLAIGFILLTIWLLSYIYIKALWANIVFFLFMIMGCYAIVLGVLQGAYSLIDNAKKQQKTEIKKSIGKLASQSILFFTQLCSLVIAILNIIKAINM